MELSDPNLEKPVFFPPKNIFLYISGGNFQSLKSKKVSYVSSKHFSSHIGMNADQAVK